jgi:3-oxoacyl-[acyl-carrier protein] reductase
MHMPVALVTGASRGLGRELAIRLSAEGYSVIVNYIHSETAAAGLVQSLSGNSVSIMADIGDSDQVRLMHKTIREKFGRIDVIINNAAIAKDNLLLRQTEPEWDAVIRTNLTGCFNVIRIFSPLMIESGGGHIINISSYSGIKGKAGQAAYSASKAGLLGLTRTAARELSGYNIRVNAIIPGYMITDMGKDARKASGIAERESLLNQFSDPGEAAEFVMPLLKTGNITGQIIHLDSRII